MDGQLFENGMIDLREYEIVPESELEPPNETPRQFLLRKTGRDFPDLAFDGRDFTWQEVLDAGGMPIITRILQVARLPRITLRRRR